MKFLAGLVALLLAMTAIAMTPTPATCAVGADCLYECEGPLCTDFGNKTDLCLQTRAKCEARCSGRRWWGSIAYSQPDQQYGYAYDWNKVDDAKAEALKRCSRTGKACKVWLYYENECGALAADGKIVTWGTAFLKENAQQTALAECRKAGGRNCAIQVWSCSTMM